MRGIRHIKKTRLHNRWVRIGIIDQVEGIDLNGFTPDPDSKYKYSLHASMLLRTVLTYCTPYSELTLATTFWQQQKHGSWCDLQTWRGRLSASSKSGLYPTTPENCSLWPWQLASLRLRANQVDPYSCKADSYIKGDFLAFSYKERKKKYIGK